MDRVVAVNRAFEVLAEHGAAGTGEEILDIELRPAAGRQVIEAAVVDREDRNARMTEPITSADHPRVANPMVLSSLNAPAALLQKQTLRDVCSVPTTLAAVCHVTSAVSGLAMCLDQRRWFLKGAR